MSEFSKVIFSLFLYFIFSVLLFFASLIQWNVNREFEFWALLVIMFGLAAATVFLSEKVFTEKELKKNQLILTAGFFIFLYFFMPHPKYFANDLLIYFFHAKMFVSSGLLPYFHIPAELSFYPEFGFISRWAGQFFNYGPLWYGISLLAPLVTKNIIWGGYVYKGVSLIFYLASLYVLYLLTDKDKKIVFLSAINPLVLFWGVRGGHNDMVMLFFVMASFYFFVKEKYARSYLALALGALVKYTAFLFLPVLTIFLWRKRGGLTALAHLILSILMFFLPYAVLGVGGEKISGASTLTNPRLSGSVFSGVYFFLMKNLEYTQDFSKFYYFLFSFALVFSAAVVAFLFSYKMSDRERFFRAIFFSSVLFVILTFWFQPWFMLWIPPLYFMAYGRQRKFSFFFGALVFYSLTYYVISYTYSSFFGFSASLILFSMLGYFFRAVLSLKSRKNFSIITKGEGE